MSRRRWFYKRRAVCLVKHDPKTSSFYQPGSLELLWDDVRFFVRWVLNRVGLSDSFKRQEERMDQLLAGATRIEITETRLPSGETMMSLELVPSKPTEELTSSEKR
jgi:hypothetical protein